MKAGYWITAAHYNVCDVRPNDTGQVLVTTAVAHLRATLPVDGGCPVHHVFAGLCRGAGPKRPSQALSVCRGLSGTECGEFSGTEFAWSCCAQL